jgi:hypothetical protein
MRRVGDVLVAVLCLAFLLPGCAAKTTRVSDDTSAPVPIAVFASETCGECLEVSGWLEGLIAWRPDRCSPLQRRQRDQCSASPCPGPCVRCA